MAEEGFKRNLVVLLSLNVDESAKSQNQTVLKKVQIQGAQILQS